MIRTTLFLLGILIFQSSKGNCQKKYLPDSIEGYYKVAEMVSPIDPSKIPNSILFTDKLWV